MTDKFFNRLFIFAWQFCIAGVREAFNPYAVLELSLASEYAGEVRIKGLETGLYLAMSSEGRLYAESDPSNDATIFIESPEGYKLTYLRYYQWVQCKMPAYSVAN